MKLDFECLEDGRWYAVMPAYEGDHEDLEMVEGADDMLSALTTDGLYVSTRFSFEEPTDGEDYFTLEMEAHDDDGAFYNVIGCSKFQGTVWFCNVAHLVFGGDYPQTLYCTVLE